MFLLISSSLNEVSLFSEESSLNFAVASNRDFIILLVQIAHKL